ncbi:unnamed protein product, partial [Meganyctiphanes norvegica]
CCGGRMPRPRPRPRPRLRRCHGHVWITFLLIATCNVNYSASEKTLLFQGNNEFTADSHAVHMINKGKQFLSELSVCGFFKIKYFRTTTYALSYSTSDQDDNELNLSFRTNQLVIAVGGKYHRSDTNLTIVPDEWFHFCFTADSQKKKATFFLNGDAQLEKTLGEIKIYLNGSVVLGQETDSFKGGFQAAQSYSGFITMFNLYDRVLAADEVSQLASCTNNAQGEVVAWDSAIWQMNGGVTEMDVPLDDICDKSPFQITLFPEQRKFEESRHFCNNLKTTIALPSNKKENKWLYQYAMPYIPVCEPANHRSGFLWLGTTDKAEEGNWSSLTGKPITYSDFDDDARATSLDCASFNKAPAVDNKTWVDTGCGSATFCVACQEHTPTILRMRGLCEDDNKATLFRLVTSESGGKPLFRGFTKYEIYHNESEHLWNLVDMWNDEVVATYFSFAGNYPFGTNDWDIKVPYKICSLPSNTSHKLALTACFDLEYSCGDGTCIDLSENCDQRVECPDNTDERDCNKLITPKDYLPALPPPGIMPGPLQVNITVKVHRIAEINIQDMTMTLDITPHISWFDQRLTYKNIKLVQEVNYMNPDLVWTPYIELVNADFPRIHKTGLSLMAIRDTKPEEDDIERVAHDEIFQGKRNPLLWTEKRNAPFSCDMDLSTFPFDTQRCKICISFTSARKEFIEWNKINVQYLGEIYLTEYEIGGLEINKEDTGNYSTVVVVIPLKRRYSTYITSAYLPSTMLMLISYASLFVSQDNRDLRVMMSITTLLVLYTLFQQISDTLPNTSYIKSLEIWFFFAIVFIFSQVIVHVAVDVDLSWWSRHKCCSYGSMHVTPIMKNKNKAKGRGLNIATIVYAIILILFCIIYWACVFSYLED